LHGVLARPADDGTSKIEGRLRPLTEDPFAPGGPATILGCIDEIAARAPVLLIIDELGQALQFASEHRRTGDFYVLQQIAERASARPEHPLYFFTLQHLSFVDYLGGAGDVERREWGKVRGRFEDIPFLESQDHTIALIERILQVRNDRAGTGSVQSWASRSWAVLDALGLQPSFARGERTLHSIYPLHPLTVLALPELCAGYAQHERTLFSYLASEEPGSVAAFIKTTTVHDNLPWIGLEHAYDYFIHSIRSAAAETPGSRWLEIDRRIRETHGLDAQDVSLLKSIGILNLISQGGAIRASRALLAYAMGSPAIPPAVGVVDEQLTRLEELGIITYRSFADEYRLWRGSDFDLARAVADERAVLELEPRAMTIAAAVELEPITAVRHTQLGGAYRYFDAVFVDEATHPKVRGAASGVVGYWVGEGDPVLEDSENVVALAVPDVSPLAEASLEAAAILRVLTSRGDDALDWVASQELAERLSEARGRARRIFADLFDLRHDDVSVWHVGHFPVPRSDRISRLVSDVCDQVYYEAPVIRSEMLSRDTLTSQAARARRDLLEALVTNEDLPRLGLEGFGPERALYEAVFAYGGLHRETADGWRIVEPRPGSSYRAAWERIAKAVSSGPPWVTAGDIEGQLHKPPFGVPKAVTPLLVSAYLVYHRDAVGVFQDGTYQPTLTPDLMERLAKIPSRFQLRDFRGAGPDTSALLAILRQRLGIIDGRPRSHRNASVLSVVAPLLGTVRSLPTYTMSTKRLSRKARSVRECLLDTREPDQLLFHDLPVACDMPPGTSWSNVSAEAFASSLAEAVRDLGGAYRRLLIRFGDALAVAMGTTPDALRPIISARARLLLNWELEPGLHAMATALASDSLEDDDWIASVALVASGRSPASWTDADEDRASQGLSRLAGMFHDAEVLAFQPTNQQWASARLVSVTAPDGRQVARVLHVDLEDEADLGLLRHVIDGVTPADERAIRAALSLLGNVLELAQASDEEGDSTND
jgi:hypothetical protein